MTNPLYDQLFGAHAGKETPFLHLADGSSITHAAFLERSAQFAHVLSKAGLAPGDRLAAQIHKSPEALMLYAACVQAGVIFLPLNTAYTAGELTYFIENSGASMVVCDGAAE
ncbi:MAG: AMP-binding protein, partial [Pseudomonadota bacterium]